MPGTSGGFGHAVGLPAPGAGPDRRIAQLAQPLQREAAAPPPAPPVASHQVADHSADHRGAGALSKQAQAAHYHATVAERRTARDAARQALEHARQSGGDVAAAQQELDEAQRALDAAKGSAGKQLKMWLVEHKVMAFAKIAFGAALMAGGIGAGPGGMLLVAAGAAFIGWGLYDLLGDINDAPPDDTLSHTPSSTATPPLPPKPPLPPPQTTPQTTPQTQTQTPPPADKPIESRQRPAAALPPLPPRPLPKAADEEPQPPPPPADDDEAIAPPPPPNPRISAAQTLQIDSTVKEILTSERQLARNLRDAFGGADADLNARLSAALQRPGKKQQGAIAAAAQRLGATSLDQAQGQVQRAIAAIADASDAFAAQLEGAAQAPDSDERMTQVANAFQGDAFRMLMSRLNDYTVNVNETAETLGGLAKELGVQAGNGLTYQQYTMQPNQRTMKYQLFLRKLIGDAPDGHPALPALKRALAAVEQQLDALNERKRIDEYVALLLAHVDAGQSPDTIANGLLHSAPLTKALTALGFDGASAALRAKLSNAAVTAVIGHLLAAAHRESSVAALSGGVGAPYGDAAAAQAALTALREALRPPTPRRR